MSVSKSKVTVTEGSETTVKVTVKVSGKAKAGIKVKNSSNSVIDVKGENRRKSGKFVISTIGKKSNKENNLNMLMNGAGTVTGSSYQLRNYAKQTICGFGNKQVSYPYSIPL